MRRNTPIWRFRDGEEAIEILDAKRAAQIDFPAAAVAAARAKARHYHCRDAHYAAAGGANGPGGALRGAGAACGGWPSPEKGPGIGYDGTV